MGGHSKYRNLSNNLLGRRFGKIITIGKEWKNDKLYMTCECDCGEIFTALHSKIIKGEVRSCGKCKK